MHPGPVNRGVELAADVIDGPQAVITAQVEAGIVVRMAVLYELVAGAQPDAPADAARLEAPAAEPAPAKAPA
jgi:aspartate carbamoyltransferase catalytic subunit